MKQHEPGIRELPETRYQTNTRKDFFTSRPSFKQRQGVTGLFKNAAKQGCHPSGFAEGLRETATSSFGRRGCQTLAQYQTNKVLPALVKSFFEKWLHPQIIPVPSGEGRRRVPHPAKKG